MYTRKGKKVQSILGLCVRIVVNTSALAFGSRVRIPFSSVATNRLSGSGFSALIGLTNQEVSLPLLGFVLHSFQISDWML
jgi:hypothetical protein